MTKSIITCLLIILLTLFFNNNANAIKASSYEAGKNYYLLQLGKYENVTEAKKARENIIKNYNPALQGLTIKIVKKRKFDNKYYLNAGVIAKRADASNICSKLSPYNVECTIIETSQLSSYDFNFYNGYKQKVTSTFDKPKSVISPKSEPIVKQVIKEPVQQKVTKKVISKVETVKQQKVTELKNKIEKPAPKTPAIALPNLEIFKPKIQPKPAPVKAKPTPKMVTNKTSNTVVLNPIKTPAIPPIAKPRKELTIEIQEPAPIKTTIKKAAAKPIKKVKKEVSKKIKEKAKAQVNPKVKPKAKPTPIKVAKTPKPKDEIVYIKRDGQLIKQRKRKVSFNNINTGKAVPIQTAKVPNTILKPIKVNQKIKGPKPVAIKRQTVRVGEAIPVPIRKRQYTKPRTILKAPAKPKPLVSELAGVKPTKNLSYLGKIGSPRYNIPNALWVNVGYFANGYSADHFWNALQSKSPELSNLRMKAASNLGSVARKKSKTKAIIGPVVNNAQASSVCRAVKQVDSRLSCWVNKNLATKNTNRYTNTGRHEPYATKVGRFKPYAPATRGNIWAVQLGSYKTYRDASARWKKLKSAHKNLRTLENKIVSAGSGRNTKYRLRAGNFTKRVSAEKVCKTLNGRKVSCIVVTK